MSFQPFFSLSFITYNLKLLFRKQNILVFLFLFGGIARSQSYCFRQLSNSNGLSQSQVLCIEQDKRGFLWMGTAGGGLNRFDGKQFKVFTTYDGLPDDNIWSLYADRKNRLWVGTSTGVSLYDNGKFKTFPSYNGLDDDKIFDITEDPSGNIWIATANNGVSTYDGSKFTSYGINDGLGFSECNRIFFEDNGTGWIGSYGYGLTKFNGGKFYRIGARDNFNAEYVFDIEKGKDGSIFFLTEKGLYQYNKKSFALVNPVEFDYTRSSDLLIDKNNTVWISTYGLGVYAIDEFRTRHFNETNGLMVDDIICLYADNSQNLWLGSNGNGLFQYTGDAFISYDARSGLSANIVRGIAIDNESNLLAGTSVGIDLIKPDGNVISYFKDEEYFNCVSIYNDARGKIWASFDNAFGYISNRGIFTKVKGLPANIIVNQFYNDENNNLWLATNDGIFVYKNEKIFRRLRDSIPETNVISLKKSLYHDHAFWICSNAGLVLYDYTYIRSVKIKKPNENIEVVDLWEDPVGKLWVITNRGLCIVDKNGKLKWLNKQLGLSSNNLFSIIYFNNKLWIGSDRGIDCINLDRKFNVTRLEYFGRNKGFLGQEVNSLGCIENNGKLFFATINGLFVFNASKKNNAVKAPDVYVSEISLNYKKINWADEFPETSLSDGIPNNMNLKYYQNYLTFYFNPIDFNSPENVKIQFMLQGLDTSWIDALDERLATYANLSPGTYVFKVRATNDHYTWGKTATIKFKITSPFWKRPWFFIIFIFFLACCGFVLSQYRIRRLRKMQERLQLKVRESTVELRRQNLELEKLSIVASKTNDGVLICDAEGKILFLNDGFKRMSGFSLEEFNISHFNKKTIQELSSQGNINEIINEIKRTGKSVNYESTHNMKNGSVMWTHASLTPLIDEGRLDKIIVLYTNITDRVITEQALIQTNKDLTDSIHYAKKIQEAILPSRNILKNNFRDSFIYYDPRDIVSGDFYWFTRIKNMFVMACADCTGHGVPGAMMTMIGNEFLHQIVNNAMVTGPDVALNLLDKQIYRAMQNDESNKESKDGMDIGLCTINVETLTCHFAGANIPLYHVRDGVVTESHYSKLPIGTLKNDEESYVADDLQLKKGDAIYISTDGFIDQLGGEKGRKFMRKKFRELIKEIHHLSMEEQQKKIIETYETHRGFLTQTDDILIIGLRL